MVKGGFFWLKNEKNYVESFDVSSTPVSRWGISSVEGHRKKYALNALLAIQVCNQKKDVLG